MIDDDVRLAILAPIDGSVGLDGREDDGEAGELLREIRSQRRALVRQEQAAAMGETVANEDGLSWSAVAGQAIDYLSRCAKDLEVASMLVEAAVREEGPQGVSETMALLADLVETFWEQGLFPVEDEDGVEARFQPLSGLSGGGSDRDGALIQPVRRMPIAHASGVAVSFLEKVKADALIASAQTGTPDQKAAKTEEAQALYAELDALSARVSRRELEAVAALVAATESDWRRAIGFISEKTKPRFPAASKLSGELQAIREWLATLIAKSPDTAAEAAEAVGDEEGAEAGGGSAPVAGSGGSAVLSGRIVRREDALRAVAMAADYFAAHEPLSPLGGALREVDRRARMSLHGLLAELIPDESARELFYWRSGIRPPGQTGAEE